MSRRFLTAAWRNLVMLNYEVDAGLLQPHVPHGTELDPWNGRHFLSIVGFHFTQTRVLGIPIPFHRNFEEVNLRFYVRRQARDGWRRGVVFIKEIVPRFAIAAVARWVYNENYVAHPMSSQVRLPEGGQPGFAEYSWVSNRRQHSIRADFEGEPSLPVAGSLEEYITEHYWGYVPQRNGSSLEYEVEHPQWRVWRATGNRFDCDTMHCYGEKYSAALSQPPGSAFVAEGSPVTVRRGEGIPSSG